jgi:hypothetical protein
MKNKLYLIIGLVVIMFLLIFIFISVQQSETVTNNNKNTDSITDKIEKKQVVVSPDGNYIANLNNSGFTILDLRKGEKHSFPNGNNTHVNYLLWSADEKRLFFSSLLDIQPIYTNFGFIDMTEQHKYDSTGLTPDVDTESAKIFEGEANLVRSKGDSIYIISKGLLYELPIYGVGDVGGAPKLIKDLNSVLNSNTNQLSGEYKTINSGNGELLFTNQKYQYSVTFPNKWVEDKINDPSLVSFYDDVAKNQTGGSELTRGMKIEISANVNEIYNLLSEQIDQAERRIGKQNIISRKDVQVDGFPAVELVSNIQGYSIVTYFNTATYSYWIAGYIGDEREQGAYSRIYHEIISTFKFTD